MDPTSWHPLVNEAALAAFAVFVSMMVWKFGGRLTARWEHFCDDITEDAKNRNQLCKDHGSAILDLNRSLQQSAQSQAASCHHLERLVEIHEAPSGTVHQSMKQIQSARRDLRNIKMAAVRACDMCRQIAKDKFADVAPEVSRHCDEIVRLMHESGEINIEDK